MRLTAFTDRGVKCTGHVSDGSAARKRATLQCANDAASGQPPVSTTGSPRRKKPSTDESAQCRRGTSCFAYLESDGGSDGLCRGGLKVMLLWRSRSSSWCAEAPCRHVGFDRTAPKPPPWSMDIEGGLMWRRSMLPPSAIIGARSCEINQASPRRNILTRYERQCAPVQY